MANYSLISILFVALAMSCTQSSRIPRTANFVSEHFGKYVSDINYDKVSYALLMDDYVVPRLTGGEVHTVEYVGHTRFILIDDSYIWVAWNAGTQSSNVSFLSELSIVRKINIPVDRPKRIRDMPITELTSFLNEHCLARYESSNYGPGNILKSPEKVLAEENTSRPVESLDKCEIVHVYEGEGTVDVSEKVLLYLTKIPLSRFQRNVRDAILDQKVIILVKHGVSGYIVFSEPVDIYTNQ